MERRAFSARFTTCIRWSVLAAVVLLGMRSSAADCNSNGIEDAEEIATGLVPDCDSNGVPDSCPVAPEARFAQAARYPVGNYPTAIASGDFDGDGRADLATASQEGEDVTILWNQGDRRFLSGEGIPVGSLPLRIEAADLDGDADLDLLVATPRVAGVAMLLNDGLGGFAGPSTLPAAEGVDGIRVADVDGDGFQDIVTVLEEGIEIAWGEGQGVFAGVRTVIGFQRPGGVQVGDLDGDSDLDLVAMEATTYEGRLYVLANRGNRTFEIIDTSTHISVTTPPPADFDGDGSLDLVAAGSHELFILFNDGAAGFRDELTIRMPFPTSGNSLLATDVDDDGDADILAGSISESGSISVLLNDGAGNFPMESHYAARSYDTLVARDLDGDGRVDIASTYPWRDEVSVVWGVAGGGFQASPMYFADSARAGPAASGDADGDGLPELMLCTSSGLTLYEDEGGRMVAARSLIVPSGTSAVVAADLTGNGTLDLAVLTGEDDVSVLLGLGDGTFDPPATVFLSGDLRALEGADLNNDGLLDLVVANPSDGTYTVLGNRGEGSFEILSEIPLWASNGPLALGDLDADGNVDIAFETEGDLEVLRGDGQGKFSAWQRLDLGNSFYAIDAVDIDADGDLDVVATTGAGVVLFLGRNDGVLAEGVVIGSTDNARSQVVADLEGDGDLDIVTANLGSQDATVFVNAGDGTFPGSFALDAGPEPIDVAAVDLKADGLPDLVVTSLSSKSFVTVLNQSTAGVTDENQNGVPDGCEERFHRGDADGDGSLSLGDATFVFGYVFLGTAAPSCSNSADANGDRRVDIGDGIFVLNFLFKGGLAPPNPGPPSAECGIEPASVGPRGPLGCERYDGC